MVVSVRATTATGRIFPMTVRYGRLPLWATMCVYIQWVVRMRCGSAILEFPHTVLPPFSSSPCTRMWLSPATASLLFGHRPLPLLDLSGGCSCLRKVATTYWLGQSPAPAQTRRYYASVISFASVDKASPLHFLRLIAPRLITGTRPQLVSYWQIGYPLLKPLVTCICKFFL